MGDLFGRAEWTRASSRGLGNAFSTWKAFAAGYALAKAVFELDLTMMHSLPAMYPFARDSLLETKTGSQPD
jgi:hypothetical protein